MTAEPQFAQSSFSAFPGVSILLVHNRLPQKKQETPVKVLIDKVFQILYVLLPLKANHPSLQLACAVEVVDQ